MSLIILPRGMLHHPPLESPPSPPGHRRIRTSLIADMRSAARRSLPSFRRKRAVRLDEFPFEVLHQIFAYACTDGGPTACSLSLVSKRIHAASRVTHFTSVSLLSGSVDMLHKFLEQYHQARKMSRVPGCQQPRVRHLCLVVDPMTCDHFDLLDYSDQTPHERLRSKRMFEEKQSMTKAEWDTFVTELQKEYHIAVEVLISVVAADLETLCLFPLKHTFPIRSSPDPYRLQVKRPGFPKLRELWSGCELAFKYWPSARWHRAPFPALVRLHMFHPTSANFVKWPLQYAPALVSFRIILSSMAFEWPNGDILAALQSQLQYGPFWPRREPVHIMSPGPDYWDDFAKPFYSWHSAHFRKEIEESGSPVVFVPYYAFQDVIRNRNVLRDECYPAGLARRDWLARISVGASAEEDGVYVRRFWGPRKGEQDDRGPRSVMKFVRRVVRADHPVMPLIRWSRWLRPRKGLVLNIVLPPAV
ncbi:hypothetical protein OH76DRAFT_1402771 [Lentinus brumalis]|uniref:F-box domain-containing protein n=1 Tax=Lentinus brumalis TaxID=2498619 RepID=A0A371DCS7_9APHY|nr:hypothetical protein OH76DRAFT_1402771 [Polyporus brumalis]